jgi:hypothetical protein
MPKPAKSRRARRATAHSGDGWRVTIERDARYPEGRVRRRFIGRGTTGAPSRAALDLADTRAALREISHAVELLVAADGDATMRRAVALETHKQALAKLSLAVRFAEEVLLRVAPTMNTYAERPL